MLGISLIVLLGGGSFYDVFPTRGIVSDNWNQLSFFGKILDYLWHMTLPIISSVIGSFAIMASTLEKQKTETNWNSLKKMSDLTQGRFIEKVDFIKYPEIIESEIGANTQTYFSKQLSDLIQEKTIFFLLLLSLFSEWTIRKSLGTH